MLESEWEKVVRDIKHQLDRSGDMNTVTSILELSYHNLPPELKACFLCLAFSKEDATLKVNKLVHIWVAQGLVRQEVVGEGEVMEDVAREYLNELISRNMIQVTEMEYDQVKACQVHDLIRDLSIRKAKEEIDFEVVRDKGNSHQSLDNKPRHRAIYCTSQQINFIYVTNNRNRYVWSLFIHLDTSHVVYCTASSSYWKSFELLRVLDLGLVELLRLPEEIGRLTGLRYLKMNYSLYGPNELPQSWAKLKNLEVLHLTGYNIYVVIDNVIVKMDSLRHLYVSSLSSEVALGGMRNLQTLSYIRTKDSDLWHIQGMGGLSTLGFDMLETSDPSTLFTSLATLENLVCLTLYDTGVEGRLNMDMEGLGALQRITQLIFVDFYSIERLPVNFPPNLSYLTFINLLLIQDPMPVLETLSKLLYLKMHNVYKGEEMVVSSRGFPTLKVLHLRRMEGIRNIEIEEDAMPELKQFYVSRCINLKTGNFPEHIICAIANAL